ncbi:MAG TPA: serine/threonine protein kinase, partial [Burkholderiales bacterium]|nr:serine/threonine protein kinase [Burkholderiales bacterium]
MHPYAALTPEVVLDALDSLGLRTDGRLSALSSYENRVYQIWLEEGAPVVGKFYRPGRWSAAQIEEEHAFAHELANREIPVVAPSHPGTFGGFIFAVYPRRGGRTPELDNPKVLEWIGRFMGRIHAVGSTRKFVHRESLTPKSFGHD